MAPPVPQQLQQVDFFKRSLGWLNADAQASRFTGDPSVSLDRILPFLFLHLGCFAGFWVGVSPAALLVAIGLYWLRMLAITAVYHRYFSHRTYQLNRFWQLLAAIWGATAIQRGPLWWASHHRKHHRQSDQTNDIHSPVQKGFWWSHIGWMCCNQHMQTDYHEVRDFSKFPELRWLNQYDWVVPLLYFIGLYGLGEWLTITSPSLDTNGLQLMVWGGFISTVVLFHGTVTINSLCHVWGNRRFKTDDHSKNNLWLALITLGEGWHNNHHFYPGSVRQGFYWWEVDIAYYFLRCLTLLGIVKQPHPVPQWVLSKGRTSQQPPLNKQGH